MLRQKSTSKIIFILQIATVLKFCLCASSLPRNSTRGGGRAEVLTMKDFSKGLPTIYLMRSLKKNFKIAFTAGLLLRTMNSFRIDTRLSLKILYWINNILRKVRDIGQLVRAKIRETLKIKASFHSWLLCLSLSISAENGRERDINFLKKFI